MKLPNVPSDGFLKALPEAERKKLGKAGMTSEEAIVAFAARKEKELQREVYNWLLLHGIYFEHDRMDKKTSGKRGRADFRCCVRGRWLSLESKTSGTLTKEQGAEAARLRASGGTFVVVRSLAEAIEAVHSVAGEP